MASSVKFKIGDVVRLKSGGADMTVTSEEITGSFGKASSVYCSWHAGKKNETHQYPIDALELVPTDAAK